MSLILLDKIKNYKSEKWIKENLKEYEEWLNSIEKCIELDLIDINKMNWDYFRIRKVVKDLREKYPSL